MKKNLLLFIVLVILIIISFYWIEKKDRDNYKKNWQTLINEELKWKDLQEIHLENIKLSKKGEDYFEQNSNRLLSRDSTMVFFNRIGRFVLKKEIPVSQWRDNEKEFLGENDLGIVFVFPQKKISYKLGKRLFNGEEFYIKIDSIETSKMVLVQDSTKMTTMRSNEKEIWQEKYERVKSLFNIPKSFFIDRHILPRNYEIKNVMIDNSWNRSFYLNFEKFETTPEPYGEIVSNNEKFNQFKSYLLQLEALKIVEKSGIQVDEKNLKSTIYFNFKKDFIKLYDSFADKSGNFVTSSFNDDILVVGQVPKSLFFKNVQDFWWINPIKENELVNIPDIPIKIKKSSIEFNFLIPQAKTFEIIQNPIETSKHVIPNFESMKFLMGILLGIGEKSSAIRVSLINETNRQVYGQDPFIDVDISNIKLKLFFHKNEIIIERLGQDVFYYFSNNDNILGPELEKYGYIKDQKTGE